MACGPRPLYTRPADADREASARPTGIRPLKDAPRVPRHAHPPDSVLAALLRQARRRPRQTPEDAASEARHLKNIRQVTFGFAKAGEGYFRPDGKGIIFQAVPATSPPSIFHKRRPTRTDYQIFAADLAD